MKNFSAPVLLSACLTPWKADLQLATEYSRRANEAALAGDLDAACELRDRADEIHQRISARLASVK